MANIYYKIDGNNCYYCNTQKSGYSLRPYSSSPMYESVSENKNVIVELTNGKFVFPEWSAGLFKGATNTSFNNISSGDTSAATSVAALFDECKNITSIDVSSFRFPFTVDLSHMFSDCSALTNIPGLGSLSATATYISSMFAGCSSLVRVDIRGIRTVNGGGSFLFNGCKALISVQATPGSIASTTLHWAFENCTSLKNIDLSFIVPIRDDFSFGSAFYNCTSLETINFGDNLRAATLNPVSFEFAFENCIRLKSIDLADAKWTINTVFMRHSFTNCTDLKEIHFDKCNGLPIGGTSFGDIFKGCVNLEHVYVKEGTDWAADGSKGFDVFTSCRKLPNGNGTIDLSRANTRENFGYFSGVWEPEPVTTYIKLTDDAWTEVTNAYIKTGSRVWKDSTIWK